MGRLYLADFDELRSILLKTVGPKAILEHHFTGLRGVAHAMIYGSWARRYRGEAGAMPQDIELLAVGEGSVAEIRAKADAASRTLARDVNVTVLTPAEWEAADSGFISHIRSGVLVELDLGQ